MNLFYHEMMHLVLSLLAGSAVYYFYCKNSSFYPDSKRRVEVIFLAAIIGGFFIDIDHWFDNWIAYGVNFDVAKFFSSNYFEANGKIIIPLHGWEYVITLLFLGYSFKKYKTILFALSLSLFLHLFVDSISYSFGFVNYSIIYRALNEFRI